MHIKGYDVWRLSTPWDDDPEPCEFGEDDCTCAEDRELERGDWLYDRYKDRDIDDA